MSELLSTLPQGWVTATIEDVFAPLEDGRTLHQGWSPQCEKGPSETDEDWGVLKTTAIQPGVFLPEHNKRLPPGLASRPRIEVKTGDILITCAGPRSRCGIACLVRNTRRRLMMSGKMYRFRVPCDFIDPRYIEAYLQTPTAQNAIDRMKTGGSDSGLNLTHNRFRRLQIAVAPLNEQRRIVEAYDELTSGLDAGSAGLERVREKLRLYRASVLKAAVEGVLTTEWRKRHPQPESAASEMLARIRSERRRCWEERQQRMFTDRAHEPPKNWKTKYKEPLATPAADMPPLPDGWCWATMDQLSWSSGYGTSQKCRETNTGLAVLRIPNIVAGRIDLEELKYAPPTYLESKYDLVTSGDLLVIRTNGSRTLIGRGAITCEEPALPLAFASYLIRLRIVQATSLWKWIAVLWESSHVRRWVETRAATSAGQFNISLGVLATLCVPLPPSDEREAIVEAVEAQLSVIEHLQGDIDSRLESARVLRQSILRHAFTGQLVPQDPQDEPASALVKRIAADRETATLRRAQRNGASTRPGHNGSRKKNPTKAK